ncbi:Tf2-6 poly [Octopus vulgaris]|uniref:Tf2-6 poly n=1 Tax=Octopus vulgaris TaxID=6645 RepID=A0AA36EXZ2_OCTVU|nr:Tf2-6 poly [Octopus vulgaris]
MDLIEEDFAQFGYPYTIMSDNATCFTSEEFQNYCKERSIIHLTRASYHPSTNGAAEHLIQTFQQALRKCSKIPKEPLLAFSMQFRRTPTTSGYSPSELLKSCQLCTKIDILLPSPVHLAQSKLKRTTKRDVLKTSNQFQVGDPCYALYFGPKKNQDLRWVPAIAVKKQGTRTFHVQVMPRGPIWRLHLEQLQLRYSSEDDQEPGDEEEPVSSSLAPSNNNSIPEYSCQYPRSTR